MECDVKVLLNDEIFQGNDEKMAIAANVNAPRGRDSDMFEEISLLGKGGSACVYLVKSKQNARLYALKKIVLDESKKSRKKENVLKEALLLSRLKHPHIVTCRSFFCDEYDDHLCIIQDYCDDGTIFDKVAEARKIKTQLEESLILKWFVQIAMAVQYIHSQKILHRDIKSQNVFLTQAGIAKLGDFGIARVMESTVDLAQTCIGTPCYLSPEVCQDLPYSSKADIWALGCLLYEMCTLQYPFDAGNLVTLYYKIVKCDYKEVSVEYSQELRDTIGCMLSKASEDRPGISAIMNNPYIHRHLQEFLKDCESKQEQFWKSKNVGDEKSSHAAELVPLKDQADKNERLSTGSFGRRKGERKVVPPVVMSSKDTGVYADDFIEEDESDYSDDFEDEDDDDFLDEEEFGSDEENRFMSVVANARDEVDKERDDESDEDFAESNDEMKGVSRNLFKRHCEELMGTDMFNQIVDICRHGKDKNSTLLKEDFEEVVGGDLLDSCFLINELVINEQIT